MIKAEIYSLAYGGAGVARIDGKVCFVQGALPEEVVELNILKNTAKYSQARVTRIIKPSPDRVDPLCPYYGKCGGCQLQHLSYDREIYYKHQQVTELFGRIARMDVKDVMDDMERSPSEYGYRTSVTLHRGEKEYGYYAASSHTVVPIDRCPIAAPAINGSLKEITAEADKEQITIKADHNGRVWSSCRMGERFYMDRYREIDIYFSTRGFSQCNRRISEKIAETLEQWMVPRSPDTALFDIYCGSGFFSFLIKGDLSLRVGIDESRVSIDCAKNTARHNGINNVKFYRGEAENDLFDIFERHKKKSNICLLDPPRKGVAKDLLEKIRDHEDIGSVFYISCDPARMARDSAIMTQGGKWAVKRIKAFDMFPRTAHIEALAEFTREV